MVYQTFRDDGREAYVLVLERLTDVTLMDTADDVAGWGAAHVTAALRGVAEVHAIWYRREDELRQLPWLGTPPTAASMTSMRELWEELSLHAFEEFPEWISAVGPPCRSRTSSARIPDWWSEIESLPRTLVHNDFNPRNIALRGRNGSSQLCAYDWELATLHLPQHDLAELLCFVLTPECGRDEVDHYVEVHRRALEKVVRVRHRLEVLALRVRALPRRPRREPHPALPDGAHPPPLRLHGARARHPTSLDGSRVASLETSMRESIGVHAARGVSSGADWSAA